jgi:hypothetical protein
MRDPVISIFHHKHGTSVAIVQEESSADFWEKHDNHDRNNADEYIEDVPLPPLFAAATDLLAACRQLLLQLRPIVHDEHEAAACEDAEAAINKAEGKSDAA